jgi:chromosome segregation ATPase
MPFPPTLIDALTHTASFLDQAGYLAKYAVDVRAKIPVPPCLCFIMELLTHPWLQRYHTLDTSYHALLKQVDGLNGQIRDLMGELDQTTTKSKQEQKDIENLRKQLASTLEEAAKKEASLTQQVQVLQKTLAQQGTHDAEDHKALDDAHDQVRTEQAARIHLAQQVIALQFALNESEKSTKQLRAQVSGLGQDISDLRGQLDAEKAHNSDLVAQTDQLKGKVGVLETDVVATKKMLARATEDFTQERAGSAEKDKTIKDLKDGMESVKKDRDAKAKAFEELKSNTDFIIQQLEEEIAKLKASVDPFPEMQSIMDGALDAVGSPRQTMMGPF